MEMILVRHGLPERIENVDGVADPGLTEVGREQANRLASWLRHEAIDHIAVSPKLRAVQTAAPLAEALGLDVEVIHGFSEIDRNSTSYIPVEEMRAEGGPHWEALMRQDWSAIGYEDPLVFRTEVAATFEKLVASRDGQRIVLVAHGGTINAIVTHLLAIEPVFLFHPAYTSITRLHRDMRDRLSVASMNETAHLEAARHTLDPL